MASTRVRFTLSHLLVSMGAVIAFAISLWVARQTVAKEQLADQAAKAGDEIIRQIRAAQDAGVRLTTIDTNAFGLTVQLNRAMGDLLEKQPGVFFLVGDNPNLVLYQSRFLRQLPKDDAAQIISAGNQLTSNAALVEITGPDTSVTQRVMLVSRKPAGGIIDHLTKIVAGVPAEDAYIAGQLLSGTMFVLLPFILAGCIGAAWYMANTAFRPMHELTRQLEAITDGRSLHRRLPMNLDNDELARLTTTINAMLSRLETSFAALRRFTADASHELKTPLAVLRADVERAMHPRTTKDDRMIALEESLQEVTRMSDLVDSLLTLARADEGRFELAMEEMRIEPLLRDVYETATILGETAGLSISMPATADATVVAERTRLRQLLLNLITNAIKYTPRGGKVEIASTLRTPTEVTITVRDTGIGISATDLPHVFDRFWRADRARSRAAERSGTGLGLAISQYIAHAHGGSLTAQSRLGRGTLFTLVLPTVEAKGLDGTPTSAAVLSRADSNSDFTDS
jgi:signal transduction histidine kinase